MISIKDYNHWFLSLHPVSLTHKSPQRCRIIHRVRPVERKDQSINLNMCLCWNILFVWFLKRLFWLLFNNAYFIQLLLCFKVEGLVLESIFRLGSITSHCLGNKPTLLPQTDSCTEFAIVNYHQSDRCLLKSSRQHKSIFLEQISNSRCRGVVWCIMQSWLCKINVNTLNQYLFLLIFMANTKATKRQSKTCLVFRCTIGHLCIQLSLTRKDQKSSGNQAYLEIICLVT